jgi:hypothetical protein
MVLSCDGLFTDWLGYTHEDMHGKPFSNLVVQREELDRCLPDAAACCAPCWHLIWHHVFAQAAHAC